MSRTNIEELKTILRDLDSTKQRRACDQADRQVVQLSGQRFAGGIHRIIGAKEIKGAENRNPPLRAGGEHQ
jgi:hypothetical protein